MAGHIARYLLSVGDWLTVSLVLGLVFCVGGKRQIGKLLVGAAALGFAVVLVFPVGGWAIAPLEDRFPVPSLPRHVDGIILLTGTINVAATVKRGQPIFYPYAERITTTMTLAGRFPTARILITGGRDRPSDPSEASVHRNLLISMGIAPMRIDTENRSRNTWENARFSFGKFHPKPDQRWILVTSAFHLPRAVGCFRRLGWNVIPYPAGYQAQNAEGPGITGNLRVLRLALHEWVGLLGYYLLGRTSVLFPGPQSTAFPRPSAPATALRRAGKT